MQHWSRHNPVAALIVLLALSSGTLLATPIGVQEMSSQEILEASMRFHDPERLWAHHSFRVEVVGTRPLAGPTTTTVTIDNAAGRFQMHRQRLGSSIETTVTGDECWTLLNGSSDYTEQQAERFGLGCEAMRRQRDYHTYLWGLPMKLDDAGTRVEPLATRTEFEGEEVWQIRVTYDPEVGTDTWYFYFDPSNYALTGYRFYHDEAQNDGEYITLDRIEEGGGLRLPKVRAWYRNDDDTLLGTDRIQSLERLTR